MTRNPASHGPRVVPAAVLALVVPLWLLAIPAFAQKGGGGGSHSGGGGGSHSSGGGGSHSSGGGGGHSSGGGGARSSSGGSTHSSTGSAGTRGTSGSSGSAGTSRQATQRGAGSTTRASRTVDGETVPPGSRPLNGRAPIGTAVPRGSVPTSTTNGALFTRTGSVVGLYPAFGFYPWLGAYGFAGYSGYSSFYYDPWYGGYSGYGGYGGYEQPAPAGPSFEEGAIHLKITPRNAQVFVDGAYVGIVDDFDGVFQKLRLDSGAHHIEVRADGYEPLAFDVQVPRDRAITYRGALQKIQ